VPEPSCRPEEAVIRAAACGTCGSELGSFVPEPPGGGLAADGHEFRHDDTIVGGCPGAGQQEIDSALYRFDWEDEEPAGTGA
jgi:hypothetical protein